MAVHEIIGLLASALGLAVLLAALTNPQTGSTISSGVGAFSGLVGTVTGSQYQGAQRTA